MCTKWRLFFFSISSRASFASSVSLSNLYFSSHASSSRFDRSLYFFCSSPMFFASLIVSKDRLPPFMTSRTPPHQPRFFGDISSWDRMTWAGAVYARPRPWPFSVRMASTVSAKVWPSFSLSSWGSAGALPVSQDMTPSSDLVRARSGLGGAATAPAMEAGRCADPDRTPKTTGSVAGPITPGISWGSRAASF